MTEVSVGAQSAWVRPARLRKWLALPATAAWVIAIGAIILTGIAGYAAFRIGQAYFDGHTYFYDPVSYAYYNAALYTRALEQGRLSTAVQDWLRNTRHPLLTVPLLVFAPALLAAPFGYMATTLPALAVFLIVLGWTIYRQTRSVVYALGSAALFSALPGMFSPAVGLSIYWIDTSAVFWIGAAALCLINSHEARDYRWLAAFAVLTAFAALSRYVAGGYALFMCGPIFAAYLVRRWLTERQIWSAVIKPSLWVGALIGIVAGYNLIAHFTTNISYYDTFGYAIGGDAVKAVTSSVRVLTSFIGNLPFAILAGLFLVQLALFRKPDWRWQSLAVVGWLVVSHIILLGLVLRVSDNKTALYALPPIFLALAPFAWKDDARTNKIKQALGVGLILAAGWLGYRYVSTTYNWVQHPTRREVAQKALDVRLAQEISARGDRVVWQSYFAEYGVLPALEAFYRFGRLPLSAGAAFFTEHEVQWRGKYGELRPEEISRKVFTSALDWVDLVVVFSDPLEAEQHFNNEYSRAVARHMAEQVPQDDRWQPVFTIADTPFGSLTGYQNQTAHQTQGYTYLLEKGRLDNWLFPQAVTTRPDD